MPTDGEKLQEMTEQAKERREQYEREIQQAMDGNDALAALHFVEVARRLEERDGGPGRQRIPFEDVVESLK